MSSLRVNLQRSDVSQSWGFRIHGGVDFNQPLLILKVAAGSISAQQGLSPGDQIIKINGEDALRLRHREVQQKIINAGNQVVFDVLRGDSGNMERVLINNCSDQPLPSRAGGGGGSRISSSSSVKTSSTTVKSSAMSTMVQNSSSVSTAAVTQGWKGPKYSEENIKELLTSQAQVLETGAIGVNFRKVEDEKNLDQNKSEVLKMLHELEEEERQRANNQGNAAPPQPTNSAFGMAMNRGYENAMLAQQSQAPWASPQHSPAFPQSVEL